MTNLTSGRESAIDIEEAEGVAGPVFEGFGHGEGGRELRYVVAIYSSAAICGTSEIAE